MKVIFILLMTCFIPAHAIAQGHDHRDPPQENNSQENADEKEIDFWTCSMHPQIKLPEAGKCPICAMDLIPVYKDDHSDHDSAKVSLKLSPSAEKLAEVSTTPVIKQAVLKEVRMVGLLDYDETRLTHITAWVPGRIDRMFVDYTGVSVNKGDHMLELYSPELISAQEEVIQAAKSITRLRASGSTLVQRSTEQAHTAAREKLRLLGLTESQVKEIERRGTASDDVTIYAPSSGVVIERNATEGMYVQTGTRIYSIADLSTLWLHLDAYESDLPWLRYGQDLEFTTQAIPGKVFHGTVSFISPVVNQMTRTTQIRVNVDNSTGALKPGLFVNGVVKAKVYAEGKVIDTSLRGKFIGPMHPEIVKDEPGACPICGMDLVKAEDLGYITDDSKASIPLIIPVSAPLLTGKRAVVYVKDPEKSLYELREVVLGPRSGDHYIVESGLKEGELVVTSGAFKIDADLQIKGKKSMMNPEGIMQSGGHDHGGEGGSAKTKQGSIDDSTHSGHKIESTQKEHLPKEYESAIRAYLDLSEALASDDLNATKQAAKKLVASGTSLPKGALRDELARLKDDFQSITDARIRFGQISKTLLTELTRYHVPKELRANKVYCPMALDGAGAYWLQRGDEVRNPYYGASMLSCGSIEGGLDNG